MFDFLAETLAGDKISSYSGHTETASWFRPEPGVIIFEPHSKNTKSVLISAAIHGNETAPVEIIATLVNDILMDRHTLKVRLMIILGNLEAMRQGKRYLDIDMNRLFSGHFSCYDSNVETRRAATLQQVVADFYNKKPTQSKLHFDLHTAIKPSLHKTFGLLPFVKSGQYNHDMIAWLQSIKLQALVVNHAPAATFSYFTSNEFAAESCTLELGKAKPFGENNLQEFVNIQSGLINLITKQQYTENTDSTLSVYKVTQVMTKRSEHFKLHFSDDLENFSAFKTGSVIASDHDVEYLAEKEEAYILFPNSKVKIGFRAGLLLAEADLSAITLQPQ
ncbi:succinylglutamate desuccinylase [Psychromonas sp. RZ22]|uniref:succinylglutamate desuccinylase n=1 Tax=Psychromonas algarum TaxID=2555643 RepID=UPI00106805B9|nr:succinylglutamate desuccinylase [Psychromonas sp. RZ22]TEW54148.1 succinylglutamate desuccinylase [Psychromonas sp. RZ22]